MEGQVFCTTELAAVGQTATEYQEEHVAVAGTSNSTSIQVSSEKYVAATRPFNSTGITVSSAKDVEAERQSTATSFQVILQTDEAAAHPSLENKDLLEMIQTEVVAPLSANIAELRQQLQDLAQKLTPQRNSTGSPLLQVANETDLELSEVTLPNGDKYKLIVNATTAEKLCRHTSPRSVIRDILLHLYNHDIKALGLLFRSFKNGGNERFEGAAIFPDSLEKAILVYMRDTWYPLYSPEKVTWSKALNKSTIELLGILLTNFRGAAVTAGLIQKTDRASESPSGSPSGSPSIGRKRGSSFDSKSPKRSSSATSSEDSNSM